MAKKTRDDNIYNRPNGTWQVRLTLGIRPDGAPNRVSKTFKTRAEARAYRDAMLATIARGEVVATTTITLRAWAARCLEVFGPSLQDDTRRSYVSAIHHHIDNDILGGMALRDIRPSHAQAWVNNRTNQRHKDAPLSPKTVKNLHGVLSWVLHLAVTEGMIASNPAANVKLPQARKPQRKVMTPERARQILELAEGSPDYAAYVLAATTGMRRSEILGLCWDCLDLQSGTYTVRRKVAIDEEGGVHLREVTKSEDSQRTAPLPPQTMTVLRSHRQQLLQRRMAAGELWEEHNLVFPDAFGRLTHPGAFSSRLIRLQSRAGLEPVGLHGFRHYLATALILRGVDILTVSTMLGHSDPSFTRKQYQDLYDDNKRAAADIAGEILQKS